MNTKKNVLLKVEAGLIIQKVNNNNNNIKIDYNGNPVGPLRVWNKTVDLPGLAMTRCFGDKAGIPAGIICDPEIRKF